MFSIIEAVQLVECIPNNSMKLDDSDIPGYAGCLSNCSDEGDVVTHFSLPCIQDKIHAKNSTRAAWK